MLKVFDLTLSVIKELLVCANSTRFLCSQKRKILPVHWQGSNGLCM